jgi:hypothetical protein
MTFAYTKTPHGYEFKGHIDETASFPTIEPGTAPLQLNFRQVTGINSLGVERFMIFVDSWNGRPVEYHQAPGTMVDAFIMLPSLLGPEENTARLRSFQAPFSCPRCREFIHLLVQDSDVVIRDGVVSLPQRACSRCASPLEADDAAQDFAQFAEIGALPRR